ncbi:hypothetical protein N7523_007754 [Penicillium sp. IBT 18751x]|nr:hypothetical protein N7523_007754 [Penicillium sp. IBT 18751x]
MCAYHCHHVVIWCTEYSNWIDDSTFPSHFPSLSTIRQQLQARGHFGDAARVLAVDSDACLGDPTAPFRDFLQAAVAEPDDVLGTCTRAWVNIKFAEKLLDLSRNEEALQRLSTSEGLLRNICSFQSLNSCLSCSPEEAFPRLWLILSATKLRLDSLTHDAKFNKLLSLVATARNKGNFQVRRGLVRDALKLTEQHEFELSQTGEMKDILLQNIDFEQSTTQSAMHEEHALIQYCTWMKSHGGLLGRGSDVLGMIDGFLTRYPQYDFPFPMSILHRHRANIATTLGLPIRSHYQERTLFWRSQCPPDKQVDAIDLDEIDDGTAAMLWEPDSQLHGVTSAERTLNSFLIKCATLILRWAQWDLQDQELTITEANKILCREDREAPNAIRGELNTTSIVPSTSYPQATTLVQAIGTTYTPNELAPKLIGDSKPRASEDWEPWFDFLEKWLAERGRRPTRFQRLMVVKQLQFCRERSVSQYILRFPEDQGWAGTIAAREGQRQVDLYHRLKCTDPRLVSIENLDAARFAQANSLIHSAAEGSTFISDQDLRNAIASLEDLLRDLLARGRLDIAYYTQNALGHAAWKRFKIFGTLEPWDATQCWTAADELSIELRLEYAALSASESFPAKEALSKLLVQSQLYQIALMAWVESIKVYYTSNKKALYDEQKILWRINSDLYLWIQRCKSRTLLESLGLKQEPPLTVLQTIRENVEMNADWERLNSLLASIATSSPLQRITLRGEIRVATDTLRNRDVSVKSFLDMREGRPISVNELLQLRRELGPSVIVVEWVELAPDSYDLYDILMVVYQPGSLITPSAIGHFKQADVENWINECLSVDDFADPTRKEYPLAHTDARRDLNMLRPLVEQLKQLTKPGDTLVFCPTGQLHRLPLHAITFDGMPLIQRNPIVYIQSLSLLRLCREALKVPITVSKNADSPFRATVFNTLPADLPQSQQSVSERLSTMTERIPNCTYIDSSNFTTDRQGLFHSQCAVSNVVHIHGHSDFTDAPEFTDGSQQCLNLSDNHADDLSLDDIFSGIQFKQPSIVLSMGCRTGRSRISAVNDLLGLTAAFHFAGAGAVIGALWKVSQEDVLRFAEAFYDELVRGLDRAAEDADSEGQTMIIDLARAYQQAVLSVRKDINGKVQKPYHWAGLVFHGSWLFQCE